MKRLLTAMAVTVLAAQAFAGPTYTVAPASGVVSDLTQVSLTFDVDNADEVEVLTIEDIVVKKDGATFSEVKATNSGATIVFTLKTPATEAGEYEFYCPADNLDIWSNGYADDVYNDEISIKYTIASASAGDSGNDANYTVSPEPGQVSDLSEITLTFNIDNVDEVEVLTVEDIVVKKDGATFSEVKATNSGASLVLKLKTPATEAGEYELYCPAGNIDVWSNSYATETYNEEISIKYTIAGATTGNTFNYTISPEAGTYESLSTVTLTCTDENVDELDISNLEDVKVYKDGSEFCDVTKKVNGRAIAFTLKTEATEAGSYEFVIPANNIEVYADDYATMFDYDQEVRVAYTIVEPAAPVVYDLGISGAKPAEGTVDMAEIQFESIIVYVTESGLDAPATSTATLASADGTYSETVRFKKNFGTQFISFISKAPTYNGDYTFTIPQGSFGDADWMLNPETGHSNPEIVINYTFTGLQDSASAVEFDLVPSSIEPSADGEVADLANVTVSFAETVNAISRLATATLTCTEQRYSAQAEVSATEGTEFTYTFEPAPTEAGSYILTIEKGAFGDADYVADQETGHASDAISVVYEFVPEGSGVISIDGEKRDAKIFSIDGTYVGKSVKRLPAGLYIRDGKKILVK